MNIENFGNYLDKLPESIQLILMVLCFPVVCLFGVLCLSGFLILVEFLVK